MLKLVRRSTFQRMRRRLARLYGPERVDQLADRLYAMIGRYGVVADPNNNPKELWDERDAVLITYADMVQKKGERPLVSLKEFCDRRLRGAINTVHLLPFCPASSDGGFSVIDYREVAPEHGTWRDVQTLGQDYELMFDLVLNHCSRKSAYFKDFINGVLPGADFFIEPGEDWDISKVVRPRPWPLLTPIKRVDSETKVWTTFSDDQIDLNWACPDVLFEFLDILLFYIAKGARIVRLDAVAFLWKEPGTECIHLPQTHEVIKLIRDVLQTVAPEVIILTETNVPHQENISYFGRGDEAHMVYNFSLPPLLLHALLKEDTRVFGDWLAGLGETPAKCTYLNFTASHDGIGVRPLQGLVPDEEIDWLVTQTRERGGLVGMRSIEGGGERPYELNITYRDALDDSQDSRKGVARFLCSQTVAMSLKGVPALYFHSFVGTHNDQEGAAAGERRDINRKRWNKSELGELLDQTDNDHSVILNVLVSLLTRRGSHPAFHPDARQIVLETDRQILAFLRESLDRQERILCLFNFSSEPYPIDETWVRERLHGAAGDIRNMLLGSRMEFQDGRYQASPFQGFWMAASKEK
ncbi:MAG: alpha-amylase family glycosyl hydrolase [Verrucomicrobiota bacterium]